MSYDKLLNELNSIKSVLKTLTDRVTSLESEINRLQGDAKPAVTKGSNILKQTVATLATGGAPMLVNKDIHEREGSTFKNFATEAVTGVGTTSNETVQNDLLKVPDSVSSVLALYSNMRDTFNDHLNDWNSDLMEDLVEAQVPESEFTKYFDTIDELQDLVDNENVDAAAFSDTLIKCANLCDDMHKKAKNPKDLGSYTDYVYLNSAKDKMAGLNMAAPLNIKEASLEPVHNSTVNDISTQGVPTVQTYEIKTTVPKVNATTQVTPLSLRQKYPMSGKLIQSDQVDDWLKECVQVCNYQPPQAVLKFKEVLSRVNPTLIDAEWYDILNLARIAEADIISDRTRVADLLRKMWVEATTDKEREKIVKDIFPQGLDEILDNWETPAYKETHAIIKDVFSKAEADDQARYEVSKPIRAATYEKFIPLVDRLTLKDLELGKSSNSYYHYYHIHSEFKNRLPQAIKEASTSSHHDRYFTSVTGFISSYCSKLKNALMDHYDTICSNISLYEASEIKLIDKNYQDKLELIDKLIELTKLDLDVEQDFII